MRILRRRRLIPKFIGITPHSPRWYGRNFALRPGLEDSAQKMKDDERSQRYPQQLRNCAAPIGSHGFSL
jgi:hypothetical protein